MTEKAMSRRAQVKRITSILPFLVFALMSVNAQLLRGQTKADQTTVELNDGLKITHLDTLGKSYSEMRLGGRIHADATFFHQEDRVAEKFGDFRSAYQFRRIFLYTSGQFNYGKFRYKVQFDFSNGIAFRDIYLEPRLFKSANGWQGYLRVGQFKDPISFENQMSSNNLTFLERSYNQNFASLRNTGLMYHMTQSGSQWAFQVAYLQNTDKLGADLAKDDGFNLTTRMTLLLLNHPQQILHAGLGYSLRNTGDKKEFKLSARPPVSGANKYIEISLPEITNVHLVTFESALISNQLMIISEYLYSHLQSDMPSDFHSYYAQLSYFLDGKSHHSYQGSLTGIQDQLSSESVFEAAVRFSLASFPGILASDDQMYDLTLGLNYYLNRHVRVMTNFTLVHLQDSGNARGFDVRFQTTF
jgi:phosphate-selective porin OprO/OprP